MILCLAQSSPQFPEFYSGSGMQWVSCNSGSVEQILEKLRRHFWGP